MTTKSYASRLGSYALTYAREVERGLKTRFSLPLQNLDVLDIGSGQMPVQLMYFATRNRAVGIDTDVIITKFNCRQYMQMARVNGTWRTLKTAARKALGIDYRVRAALQQQLGLAFLPQVEVLLQDACELQFADDSFDFVHSRSVFHHIPDPAAALREVVRVLRPGGVFHGGFHLYTSPNGSLDPRQFHDEQGNAVLWPHLRPQFAAQVSGNAFLNKLRLHEWRSLVDGIMGGGELLLNAFKDVQAHQQARMLVARGELPGYSEEELLVHDVTILWRKPRPELND
jgi:SAM-dependent methyltransferase